MLCLCAFFFINQMPVLLWNCHFTVLDFVDLTAGRIRIEDHHVKFTDRELQDEYLLLRIRQLRLQQDNILQHAPTDFGQNTLLNRISFHQ